MANDEAWGRNLRSAKRRFEEKHDTRLTYAEIGKRVAKVLGRDEPFTHSTVYQWIEGGQEPEGFPIVRALALVLETDVGALLTPPTNGIQSGVNQDVPRHARPVNPQPSGPTLRDQAKPAKRRKAGGT